MRLNSITVLALFLASLKLFSMDDSKKSVNALEGIQKQVSFSVYLQAFNFYLKNNRIDEAMTVLFNLYMKNQDPEIVNTFENYSKESKNAEKYFLAIQELKYNEKNKKFLFQGALQGNPLAQVKLGNLYFSDFEKKTTKKGEKISYGPLSIAHGHYVDSAGKGNEEALENLAVMTLGLFEHKHRNAKG